MELQQYSWGDVFESAFQTRDEISGLVESFMMMNNVSEEIAKRQIKKEIKFVL